LKKKLLKVEKVSFAYDKDEVLKDISFELDEGDFFAITGPNGGGKSTLIKLLLGINRAKKGKIEFFNINKDDIGYVPQNTNINLDFPITVLNVVMMGNKKKHKNRSFFSFKYSNFEIECAKHSLAKVGMQDYIHSKISNLSGGQRQRVMIARAICSHPKLLILDEPTSNIDIYGQKEIYKLLKELNKEVTILVVTHDLTVIAKYANKVLYVNHTGYLHDLKDINVAIDNSKHFCEVELMQMLGEKNA
jgi:zinc transport system ATP-binding protein